MTLTICKRMDVLHHARGNKESSQVFVQDTQTQKDHQENFQVLQPELSENNGSNYSNFKKMSEGVRDVEHSKLKLLLQAPGKASMASSPHAPLHLTSRWGAEGVSPRGQDHKEVSPRGQDHKGVSPRGQDHKGVSPRGQDHKGVSPRGQDHKVVSPRGQDHKGVSPREQDHKARISNACDNGSVNYKHSDAKNDDATDDVQMFPLDLSCKNPQRRSSVQDTNPRLNIPVSEQRGDSVQNVQSSSGMVPKRRPLDISGGVAETLPSPISKPPTEEQSPPKAEAAFDPLFILSQVACEKLNELQSTNSEEKKPSGKGKSRSKKCKKGQNKGTVRKSKKKDKKLKDLSKDKLTNVASSGPPPGLEENHIGHVVRNINDNQSNKQNGYLDNHVRFEPQTSVASTSTSAVDVSPKVMQDRYHPPTGGSQSSDYLELSQKQKKEDAVDGGTKAGEIDKSSWPYTCRTCHTRFKNAAFLKIHEKIAHENKVAHTDPSGNHIRFVSKDNSANTGNVSKENGTPNPFPIHWKNPSTDSHPVDGQSGYTAIPCILKVHRQTSTSEMSSSVVKLDEDFVKDSIIQGSKDRFQYKLEADPTARRYPAEFFKEESAGGGSDNSRQRPKLEVDGSAYEIIRVEREKSAAAAAAAAENATPQTSNKGFQHKFYLQICDRNQSGEGVDSTVKIESGPDDKDIRSDLKKKLIEGNPNQIRVPTSLALKFIPGDSSDPQRQPGYQHKVYLRIVDGSESSIRIKTGSVNAQSPMGSTAVKIESTYMNEMPRHHHVNDTSRPHKCHYCPKHFPSISALTAHERIHTGEKPYECRFCGRAFYHQNDRRKHERIHTGEKPYQCSICGHKFTNKGQVKIHERNHTGERPYQCRHCHKCFKSISNVNRHEKIHTGLKPYTCPVCKRGFSRREHVRTHEEICRKKMLEDDEELADDPIGDVKLPYYRKIAIRSDDGDSPVEGDPPFSDQPPEKKSRLEKEADMGYYQDREHWSVQQIKEMQEYRREIDRDNLSSRERRDSDDDRDRTDEMSPRIPIGSGAEEMSPLLYNSGPPVKPEAVSSSSSGGSLERPMVIDDDIEDGSSEEVNKTRDVPSDEIQLLDLDHNTRMYSAKPLAGSTENKSMPMGHDGQHRSQNTPAREPLEIDRIPNKSKFAGLVESTKTPPVLYVAGSDTGNKTITEGHYPSDNPSLMYLNVPKGARPPVVQKSKPVSDKLSAHIESLEPYTQQSARLNLPDPAKKEPRLYVCGAQSKPVASVIQMGTSQESKPMKLSESMPESARLKGPFSQNSGPRGMPVEIMYSSTQKQEPEGIPMMPSPRASPTGEDSPPVLYLADSHDAIKPKLVSEKSTLDEPPELSGPHVDRDSPKTAGSPANTIPPLLERNSACDNERPIIDKND